MQTENGFDNLLDSSQYLIQSNVIVNNDSLRIMHFAEAKKETLDTLKLKIFETNPAYHQELTITLIHSTYTMHFSYFTSGPFMDREIETQHQSLILKNKTLNKGDTLFGQLDYKGICKTGCKETITIKGDFKAIIE